MQEIITYIILILAVYFLVRKFIFKPKNSKKQKTSKVNFFKLLLVFVISFVAFILIVDTFIVQISEYIPFAEKYLDNLYQSIIDISLFFQNLIK